MSMNEKAEACWAYIKDAKLDTEPMAFPYRTAEKFSLPHDYVKAMISIRQRTFKNPIIADYTWAEVERMYITVTALEARRY
jgi:hypothetical protein